MNFNKMRLLLFSLVIILAAALAAIHATLFAGAPAKAHAQSLSCGKWQAVSNPNPSSSTWSLFNGIAAISANDVWAVGGTTPSGSNVGQTLAEHWGGKQWAVVPSPNEGTASNQLSSVAAVSTSDVWAVGTTYQYASPSDLTLIEHWNGSAWSVVPSPDPGTAGNFLTGVAALSANNVWAVGYYSSPGTIDLTLILHWDGTSWSVVSSPNPGASNNVLDGIAAASPTNIWAVGGDGGTLTEHWNGSAWSVVPSPNRGIASNGLNAVTVDPITGDAWSVGYDEYNDHARTLIEYWNGTKWSFDGGPDAGAYDNYLNGVVEVSPNDVWAVGYYISAKDSFNRLTLREQWNGTKWNIVAGPNPSKGNSQHDDYLNALAQVPGTTQVWAAGYFIAPPPDSYTLTETYC